MAFVSDVKSEIIKNAPKDMKSMQAELMALLQIIGSISFQGIGKYSLSVTSENASVVRYCFSLIRQLTVLRPQIQTVRSSQLGEHTSYRLHLSAEESMILLEAANMLDSEAFLGIRRIPPTLIDEHRRAYIRGAFLACGYISPIEKEYSAEFAFSNEDTATAISNLLRLEDIHCGTAQRKNQFIVYIKSMESVGHLLAVMSAFKFYMQCEDTQMKKQLNNNINRQLNCDEANSNKTLDAAESQLRDIDTIIRHDYLDQLPDSLLQIAQARLNYPEINLTQLGAMLSPAVSKSGVNNRFRRLSAIAQKLRDDEPKTEHRDMKTE